MTLPIPTFLRPPPVLERYVSYLFALEADAPPPGEPAHCVRVLPVPHAQLVFAYGEPSFERVPGGVFEPSPDYAITGFLRQVVEYACPGRLGVIMAGLHPWGLRPFLRRPVPDLTDRNVLLQDGLRGVGALEAGVRAAATLEQRVALIEAFLVHNLRQPALDEPIVEAIEEVIEQKGVVELEELAVGSGIGPRQFRRRFRAAVGVTPSRFCQIVRFQRTLEVLDVEGARFDWPAIALAAGFYDQSHFINSFRAFTGMTPLRYVDLVARTEVGRVFDAARGPAESAVRTYI